LALQFFPYKQALTDCEEEGTVAAVGHLYFSFHQKWSILEKLKATTTLSQSSQSIYPFAQNNRLPGGGTCLVVYCIIPIQAIFIKGTWQ
jgi:hypothetical protein